jgi:uncharacterized protein YhhL (DUF1145 family)
MIGLCRVVFWDIMPCSPLNINWCFWGTCHFQLQSWRVSKASQLTLQPWRWRWRSSKTAENFQQTTSHYSPAGRILHNHSSDNLKSLMTEIVCDTPKRYELREFHTLSSGLDHFCQHMQYIVNSAQMMVLMWCMMIFSLIMPYAKNMHNKISAWKWYVSSLGNIQLLRNNVQMVKNYTISCLTFYGKIKAILNTRSNYLCHKWVTTEYYYSSVCITQYYRKQRAFSFTLPLRKSLHRACNLKC